MAGLVDGKAGLVTGAAGGIGRATALTLAREGASGIVVNDLESRRADGEETVRLIEEGGGTARFVSGDVSSATDQKALVTATVEASAGSTSRTTTRASSITRPSRTPRKTNSTASSTST